MTKDIWDQASKIYEETYQKQYLRADHLEKQLLTKLLSQFLDARTVLEVGCGTAHFTKWLQTQGYQSTGLDLSRSMLTEAKHLWSQGNLIQADGRQLPIQDKSMDIVLFVTSLEFIPNTATAIKEAVRIAKQGLILGLLNKIGTSAIKRRLNPKKAPFLSYATTYSIQDIQKFLAKSVLEEYEIGMWSTTVFPRIFGGLKSQIFPYGDFLGIAVKLV
jgi:ubiquinone/menaquinone biosynthesis C-methylase UbiE